jgi:hypothetical protein
MWPVPGLSLDTVVARRPEPITRAIDDELVMLDRTSGRYFALDPIGRRIWALLERPQPIGELCGTLQEEFDVSPETCRAEVLAFLDQLSDAELLVTD